ncbi:transposase [bacterium]|nr:transposase [bacterium]
MTTLADIFTRHAKNYLDRYAKLLLPSHKRVLRDVILCRTESLSGQTYFCQHCREYHYSYHSCRNRHCPKCQNNKADDWLDKQQRLLLPAQYFMATVTAPEGLRAVFRSNQKVLYSLLFKTSAEAIGQLALDRRFIGGKIGILGVMQTWTRQLAYHPHIHYLIPGCALDGNKLRIAKKDFLLHVKPLSILIRAKFRDACIKADLFDLIPQATWQQNWVVHIEPVGNGVAALKYLAPYIFRVAISDRNILSDKNGKVTFRYRESKTHRFRLCSLDAITFISRFLQHVLPKGFVKVRYYGLFASQNRKLLEKVKERLGQLLAPVKKICEKITKSFCCPKCGSPMLFMGNLPHKRGPPLNVLLNGSGF